MTPSCQFMLSCLWGRESHIMHTLISYITRDHFFYAASTSSLIGWTHTQNGPCDYFTWLLWVRKCVARWIKSEIPHKRSTKYIHLRTKYKERISTCICISDHFSQPKWSSSWNQRSSKTKASSYMSGNIQGNLTGMQLKKTIWSMP